MDWMPSGLLGEKRHVGSQTETDVVLFFRCIQGQRKKKKVPNNSAKLWNTTVRDAVTVGE